jgi:immune inhibitor A
MKKILLSLSIAIMATVSIHAHKAWPYPLTYVQSNGDTITVRLNGDDYFHWYTDMEGNILERHGNDFKKIDVDKETFFARAQQMLNAKGIRREPIAKSSKLFPHMGSPKAVVILAQYQDVSFSLKDPRASFEQYLNGTDGRPQNLGNYEHMNYGSVKQYFIDQSDGKFSPQFDIYGPVTLPHDMAYYGGTAGDGSDEKYRELLIDACTAMNDSLDFSQYDQDGDGNIDLVYVIYAGYGQSNGAANETMWPKRFSGFTNPKFDGKGVNQAGISNELFGKEGYPSDKRINGIGLFCHEFSHCLGLPDFYATKSITSVDNLGMEDWSLMDNGEYVGYGYCPVAYTAWEREAMGWDTIPAITEAKQYMLDGSVSGGTNAVKIENPNNKNEYFVLQHFENTKWNQLITKYKNLAQEIDYKPETKGLLIYHVDYQEYIFSLGSNSVNNNTEHPRMTVIPADGKLVSSYKRGKEYSSFDYVKQLNGDIFRADDTYTDSTFVQTNGLPNAAWWQDASETPIYNINYTDGRVYFDFLKHFATSGIMKPQSVFNSNEAEKIYTIDGRYVGTDTKTLPRGIYIRGGKKFIK